MNFDWKKIIDPEEVIQKEFTISSRYRNAVSAVIVVIALFTMFVSWYIGILVVLLGALYWYYLKNSKHYAFTNKRMVLVDSLPGMSVVSIDYSQITDIEMEQNVFDQIGGWGTLIINTAGTHVPEVNLSYIENVQAIKQQLDEMRDGKK